MKKKDLINEIPNFIETNSNDNITILLRQFFDPIPIPMLLLDNQTNVIMINESFLKFLNVDREDVIGQKMLDVDRNSRFPYVFKSKKPEIAWRHTFQNGHTAIVHRIPVLNGSNEVIYGFGMVLFEDMEKFKEVIEKNRLMANELTHYKKILRKLQGASYNWESIIGNSKKIQEVKYLGKRASETGSTVLITGESGTGKELFAHAIHSSSKRSHFPFIKVNCAAIPESLLESELFGYVDGAFTGAKKGGKVGKFELANKGTIFLDEIGDMPMFMQAKILRTLQEKEIERIGDFSQVKIDVRVIAATNKKLDKMIVDGEFREDLYYRLNVVKIEIPSLRERSEDLEELVLALLEKISSRLGKYVVNIDNDVLESFKKYSWPGNVRELENILERAVNITESDSLEMVHFSDTIIDAFRDYVDLSIDKLRTSVERLEEEEITKCLKLTGGNKARAAKLLDISRSSLYEKILKYSIHHEL